MAEASRCRRCHSRYENAIGNVFGRYGVFIASSPKRAWIVLSVCIIVNLLLGLGLLRIQVISDSETLYTPQNNQASKDRAVLQSLFSDSSDDNFYSYSQTDFGYFAEVLIRTKNDINILTSSFLTEIKSIDSQIRAIEATSGGSTYNFSEVCALRSGSCEVSGEFIMGSVFETQMLAGNISYPIFFGNAITSFFGNVQTSGGLLTSATIVRLIYNLRNSDGTAALAWENAFLQAMDSISSTNTIIAYQSSDSINSVLDESTSGDTRYFSVTVTLMIMYAQIAGIPVSRNCVSCRANLSITGVFAAILSILASFGFVSLIGVEFVNIVAVMPYLIIGIGIDDTFILLSGMADAHEAKEEPGRTPLEKKMHYALKHSGVAITITSITDFLAFAIGASSSYISVRNFCLYTGVAVLFCYFNQLFFFVPCIAINERRVASNRHFMTCRKIKTRGEEESQEKGKCYVECCTGSQPKNRDDYDSIMEKYPKLLFQWLVKPLVCKIVILVCFAAYLAVSIYGTVNLRQGLELKNLALKGSYFYTFDTWKTAFIPSNIPISLVITSRQSYSQTNTQNLITSLLRSAHADRDIDDNVEINWLTAYQQDVSYTNTSESAFVTNLVTFVQSTNTKYKNDVLFDSTNTHIEASRFYVFTNDLKDSQKQGAMMLRMRDITSSSSLPCFAFSPQFVFFEQFVTILSATLQTVGIAVAVMTLITIVFMPYPVLVVLVIGTMMMILVGIFGFMYFWDLSLSSVTMIQLVMTVGFSVDFSAHICHAFISVSGNNRAERVHKALDRAGGPIINASFSSILGIMMLLRSSGYIFLTFFKLMLLVVLFGLLHSVLFLPVVLSILGPQPASVIENRTANSLEIRNGTSAKDGPSDNISEKETKHSVDDSVLQTTIDVNVKET